MLDTFDASTLTVNSNPVDSGLNPVRSAAAGCYDRTMTDLLWLFSGIVLGAVLAALGVSLLLSRRQGALGSELSASEARADAADARVVEIENRLAESKADVDTAIEARDTAAKAAEEARIATTRMEGNLKAANEKHDEHARGLEEARKRFEESFKALGVEALKSSSDQFVKLAKAHFDTAKEKIDGDLTKRHEQLELMLKPMKETMTKQQESLQALEVKREKAYSGIEKQMELISEGHKSLRDETGKLVSALRRPEQRGRWGEMALRNIVELAGMSKHCDFQEQVTVKVSGSDAKLRPDMIVKLPGGGEIVVDSKVALDAYLDMLESSSTEQREGQLQRHAAAVEKHVKDLADKKYWKQFERTPKIVVMFMPIESALVAALERKPNLQHQSIQERVLICTPTLLVGLLQAVAFGWHEEEVAANAREISNVGAELYDRIATFTKHLSEVGTKLRQSSESYNKAIGSLESRVLPATKQLRELHASHEPEINSPEVVELEVRRVSRDELLLPPGEETEATS